MGAVSDEAGLYLAFHGNTTGKPYRMGIPWRCSKSLDNMTMRSAETIHPIGECYFAQALRLLLMHEAAQLNLCSAGLFHLPSLLALRFLASQSSPKIFKKTKKSNLLC